VSRVSLTAVTIVTAYMTPVTAVKRGRAKHRPSGRRSRW
jgi:hypothetical protein